MDRHLVFATEEYPDYLNTQFNDVGGIFIDRANYTTLENIISIDGENVTEAMSGELSLNNLFRIYPQIGTIIFH